MSVRSGKAGTGGVAEASGKRANPANPAETPAEYAQRNFMLMMGQITRQWRRVIDRRLQPLGLTQATWLPLLHLARAEQPMRQKDLAASLGLDSSSVVRLLDGLQSGGLIERWEGEDRRAKTVHVTALGDEIVRKVEAMVAESRSGLFSVIDPAKLQTAFAVVEELSATLDAIEQDGV